MKYHPMARPLPYQSAPPVTACEAPQRRGYYELPLLGVAWLHLAFVAAVMAFSSKWEAAAGIGLVAFLVALRGVCLLRRIAIEWDEEVQAMTAGCMQPETQDCKMQDAREEEEKRRARRSPLESSSLGSCVSRLKGGPL